MERLANLVIAAVGVAEAEARSLKRHLTRLGIGLILVVAAVAISLTALGFLSWALLEWLTNFQSRAVAAAILGLTQLLVVGGIAWQAKRLLK